MAEQPESAPANPWWGRLVRALIFVGVLAGVAVAAGGAALCFPYLRDDLSLDRAVLAVALDWRDFGEEKARERLAFEFAAAKTGTWVTPEDCDFEMGPAGREVRCQWSVVIRLPGGRAVPWAFESRAVVDAQGRLR